MLDSPFRFEKELSSEDFEFFGRLLLRVSHIEHMIANCLKLLLRLNDDEAVVMIFPLTTRNRLERIRKVVAKTPLPTDRAKAAFAELEKMMEKIPTVRNNVVHGVLMGEQDFLLRSHERVLTKAQIFESEEIVNYAAIMALTLRHELGDPDPAYQPPDPLPNRPNIPEFLRS